MHVGRLELVAPATGGGGGTEPAELNVADVSPEDDEPADVALVLDEPESAGRATNVFGGGGAARTAALILSVAVAGTRDDCSTGMRGAT